MSSLKTEMQNAERYYLLSVMSGKEEAFRAEHAGNALVREIYFPMASEARIHRKSKKKILLTYPMLAGYVFVNFRTNDFHFLQSYRFYSAPVRLGECLTYVREKEIERLKKIERGVETLRVYENGLHVGDSVVCDSALLGRVEGKLERIQSDRGEIVLYVGGKPVNVKLKVNLQDLEKLKEGHLPDGKSNLFA